MPATTFKVAVYLYPNVDLLDFSGPAEIYSYRSLDGPAPFEITSFAHHNPVASASSALVYVPNATFQEVEASLEMYDVLVIPGAHFDTIPVFIDSIEGKQLAQLIKRFSELPPRKETGQRVLQSVCTGAVLVASSGILANRIATTHHMGLEMLKEVADQAAGGRSNITVENRKRWVDVGTTGAGVRIITAGGVSSGIDTSLYIVELLAGREAADWASEVAEFDRRDVGWGAST